MDLYSLMRQFADSWFLLAMTLFFLGAVLWAFRPGASHVHKESSQIPFRHDDRPDAVQADPGTQAKMVTK